MVFISTSMNTMLVEITSEALEDSRRLYIHFNYGGQYNEEIRAIDAELAKRGINWNQVDREVSDTYDENKEAIDFKWDQEGF